MTNLEVLKIRQMARCELLESHQKISACKQTHVSLTDSAAVELLTCGSSVHRNVLINYIEAAWNRVLTGRSMCDLVFSPYSIH